jgi:hypothetical protein
MSHSEWNNERGDLAEQYQLAGDAVRIAPVSSQIPCKQGIFQGNRDFGGSRTRPWSRNALQYSAFPVNSLLQLTGKFPKQTGY